eukprot:5297867-Prymnesium_polylepis.1
MHASQELPSFGVFFQDRVVLGGESIDLVDRCFDLSFVCRKSDRLLLNRLDANRARCLPRSPSSFTSAAGVPSK